MNDFARRLRDEAVARFEMAVTAQDRALCLRQISYAQRDYALLAADRITKKTGRAVEIVPCPTCRGFHLQKKES